MQDVIVKLVSVFVDKDSLETLICFVCHQLDHQSVLLAVDQTVIANMEPQINVSVIMGTLAIHIQDVKTLSTRPVPISNADHTLLVLWQLECLNVFVKRVILVMPTTNVLI